MRAQKFNLFRGIDGGYLLTAELPKESLDEAKIIYSNYHEGEFSLEINTPTKKRSSDANALLWKICDVIAKTVGVTKEDVYKRNIIAVGVFDTLHIKEAALPHFISAWQSRGIGWVVEVVDDSPMRDCKLINAYYGSSTYSVAQMSMLIDQVKQDADAVGIQFDSDSIKALLKEN